MSLHFTLDAPDKMKMKIPFCYVWKMYYVKCEASEQPAEWDMWVSSEENKIYVLSTRKLVLLCTRSERTENERYQMRHIWFDKNYSHLRKITFIRDVQMNNIFFVLSSSYFFYNILYIFFRTIEVKRTRRMKIKIKNLKITYKFLVLLMLCMGYSYRIFWMLFGVFCYFQASID